MIVDKKTEQIICTQFSNGKKHDFRLFKESEVRVLPRIQVITDSGYTGIQKLHGNSEVPYKRTKNHPLTPAQKEANHQIASKRALNENVLSRLKRYKILSDRYRNRRKRFGLRFNLIAGIYNFELHAL